MGAFGRIAGELLATPERRRLVEWLSVGGLPLASVCSLVLMASSLLLLAPALAWHGDDPTPLTRLALDWRWHLLCSILPLAGFAACYLAVRGTLSRVLLSFVVFHAWLVLFVLTAAGMLTAIWRVNPRGGL